MSVFKMKSLLPEFIGSGVSVAGTITARMETFEYWFRQLGTLVAIVAGLLTIYSWWKKRRAV